MMWGGNEPSSLTLVNTTPGEGGRDYNKNVHNVQLLEVAFLSGFPQT